MKKTKLTIEELDKLIIEEFGKRHTACYENPNGDGTIVVEVPEDCEEDAEDVIKEAGYKIKESDWFSGSSFDGIAFYLK